MEEGVFVHLLRPVGVADEHDLDVTIAALEKHVEQHVKALGQILHVLGHRAGHVHQTEHHRLRDRLRNGFETPISYVDRIYERYSTKSPSQRLDLLDQLDAPLFVLAIGQFGLEPERWFPAADASEATRRAIARRTVRLTERFAGEPELV